MFSQDVCLMGDWLRGLVSARQLFFWPEGHVVLLAAAEDEIYVFVGMKEGIEE
jgi:hypothetical protein